MHTVTPKLWLRSSRCKNCKSMSCNSNMIPSVSVASVWSSLHLWRSFSKMTRKQLLNCLFSEWSSGWSGLCHAHLLIVKSNRWPHIFWTYLAVLLSLFLFCCFVHFLSPKMKIQSDFNNPGVYYAPASLLQSASAAVCQQRPSAPPSSLQTTLWKAQGKLNIFYSHKWFPFLFPW